MKSFEELKSQWKGQPDLNSPANGYKIIIEKTKYLKKKQQMTNAVLILTVLLLIMFFFYISAHKEQTVTLALLLMISVLIGRVILEIISIKKLNKINVGLDTGTFKQKLSSYYRTRIKTHYVFTPIIIALYITGFVILMPFFKLTLSPGFYTYIKVSSIIIFVIGTLLIAKQIKKEIGVLKEINK